MRIEIGNKNKIKNSNIGVNNKIKKEDKGNNVLIDILVGLFVGIVGGIAVYLITKYLLWNKKRLIYFFNRFLFLLNHLM